MELKEVVIKEIMEDETKTGRLYDYVANYYYQLNNEQLKDLLLEVIYAYDTGSTKEEFIEALEERMG